MKNFRVNKYKNPRTTLYPCICWYIFFSTPPLDFFEPTNVTRCPNRMGNHRKTRGHNLKAEQTTNPQKRQTDNQWAHIQFKIFCAASARTP